MKGRLTLPKKPKSQKNEPEKQKRLRAEKILNELQVWRDYLPLEVDSFNAIRAFVQEKDSSISGNAIRALIYTHNSEYEYVKNVVALQERYNLFTGDVVSPVSEEDLTKFKAHLKEY